MTDQKTPLERLRSDLAHYNTQAEDIGATMQGSTAWRFSTRLFHRLIEAIEDLDAEMGAESGLSDDELAAVLAVLGAGASLVQALDAESRLKKGTGEALATFGAAMEFLAGTFRPFFEADQGDEGPPELDPGDELPQNGAPV